MIGKCAGVSAGPASPFGPAGWTGCIDPAELARLRQAVLHLRRNLARPGVELEGAELSLTAHFLNLAPSGTTGLRLWMSLCTDVSLELLGDPLAHLRPVGTLGSATVALLLDRVAERLGVSSPPC